MVILVDYTTISSILIALISVGIAVFREAKYRNTKAQFLAVLGDVANSTAYIYDRASNDQLCSADTLQGMADKAGKIWTDLSTLGPSVLELLDQKSDLAMTLQSVVATPLQAPIAAIVPVLTQPNPV